MNHPEYIVIHHSATADGIAHDWEAIRRYHMGNNGWSDIGYHYGVENRDGRVVLLPGRSKDTPGAHCKEAGMNRRSIGVCVVGNYDVTVPDLAHLAVLRNICAELMDEYRIPLDRVIGHRDAGLMAGYDWRVIRNGVREYKTCPGMSFPMDTLKSMICGQVRFI